jgi:formylglycine-generating enzyme required for sulfatase activity
LTAEYGIVFLHTQPPGVGVLLDDRTSIAASGRLRLTTRPHVLTVSKPGYITQNVTVTPRKGISQNVTVSLQTAEQAGQKKTISAAASTTSVTGQHLQLLRPETTFTMGASRREAGRRANESQRTVKLNRPFYFASKEVTNADFRRFQPAHDSGNLDGAALNGDMQPVVNVSWNDAVRYCNWLSKQDDLPAAYIEQSGKLVAVSPMNTGYRLPTEAEWAWVARMQGQKSEQRYAWQGNFPPVGRQGNYADASIADTLADIVPGYNDGYRGTAPVASFPPWPKGFYDLGGNVAEWIHDFYSVYPGQQDKLVIDPSGPPSGVQHVVRGAGWRHGNITELRLSYRDYSSKPRYDLGFRVARYAE